MRRVREWVRLTSAKCTSHRGAAGCTGDIALPVGIVIAGAAGLLVLCARGSKPVHAKNAKMHVPSGPLQGGGA